MPASAAITSPAAEASLHTAALAGCTWPVVQAPMAGSQGSALALAVCRAGGLGSLPAAMLAPDALRAELQALREGAQGRPWNLNFFAHSPPEPDAPRMAAWMQRLAPWYTEFGLDASAVPTGPGRRPFDAEAAALVAEFRPPVLSFHFGLPAPELLAAARASGARIWSSATTVDEGLWLQERGVDAVIAQGLEAGGHRGHFLSEELSLQSGTLALTRQLVRALRVPVIAAGGIADPQGVRAVLALGAVAAQVGSAYLLCPEASTSAIHRAALQSPQARHTVLTNLFSGRPARGIVNRFMRELGPLNPAAPAFPLATAAVAPLRAAAEAHGLGDCSPLWAGQNAAGAPVMPAAELTRWLGGDAGVLPPGW